ncbi:MAG: SDR family oxidoreductase [Calditrichaceae bacterium]
MISLFGKTAIVTGGGSGIGKAISKALIHEGVNVILASRRFDLLRSAADDLNKTGKAKAIAVRCDLRVKGDIVNLVKMCIENFASIDILVNNSGLGVQKKIVDLSDDEWDLVMDTNLKGAFMLTREVLPTMIRQQSGFIMNIASQAAKHGYPDAGVYCASKFGLAGFAEALQQEVREYGIRVHSLNPGLVQVPPPGEEGARKQGFLQVDDIARIAVFLLKQSPEIKFEDIGLFHL